MIHGYTQKTGWLRASVTLNKHLPISHNFLNSGWEFVQTIVSHWRIPFCLSSLSCYDKDSIMSGSLLRQRLSSDSTTAIPRWVRDYQIGGKLKSGAQLTWPVIMHLIITDRLCQMPIQWQVNARTDKQQATRVKWGPGSLFPIQFQLLAIKLELLLCNPIVIDNPTLILQFLPRK